MFDDQELAYLESNVRQPLADVREDVSAMNRGMAEQAEKVTKIDNELGNHWEALQKHGEDCAAVKMWGWVMKAAITTAIGGGLSGLGYLIWLWVNGGL